ncbi:13645_t:CDS:2, partial [Gigaspora rosea]
RIDENASSFDLHTNQTGSMSISYIAFDINQTSQTDQLNYIVIQIFDPESQDLIADSEYANTYIIGPGNLFILKYSKKIREVLVNIPKNLFAMSPEYERIPYITSNLATVPLPSIGNQTFITIGCASTTVETEEERLILTFFDVFGFVGGLITLVASINLFLFGETVKNPWGIVQSLPCCGIKRRVQNVLYDYMKEQIPFADEGSHLEHHPERIEDRISAIEQRHKALEFLLQDYVVNVNILYDKDINSRFYKYSKIKNDKLSREEEGLE